MLFAEEKKQKSKQENICLKDLLWYIGALVVAVVIAYLLGGFEKIPLLLTVNIIVFFLYITLGFIFWLLSKKTGDGSASFKD